jgi:multimeric flavodoxin WrbA
MKLLLISSSPHDEKSATLALARKIAEGAGGECGTVFIGTKPVMPCLHCELCHKEPMHCPIKDEGMAIARKMLEADGIILAAPNYVNSVPAQLKALMDRTTHFIHCKRLLGKYFAGAVTSGSNNGNGPILEYLRHYANVCGAQYSGGVYSQTMAVGAAAQKALELGRELAADIAAKTVYKDQTESIENSRAQFAKIVSARREHWPAEYEYFVKKGWIK